MKKVIATLLTAFMLFSVPAFSEESSLSEMSTPELIERYDAIYSELMRRVSDGANDSTIARGHYIVGDDIAPGKYEFTCMNSIVEGEHEFAYISIYKILNLEEFEKQLDYTWYSGTEECYYSKRIEDGNKVSFTLDNNMILIIVRCDGILLKSPSHEWAP